MTKIKIRYNESKNVYQATGEDAHTVWAALNIFDIFEPTDEAYNLCEVKPENLQLFTSRMKECYKIEVITA